MSPTIIIVAGPNCAGKTTFALSFLPQEANSLRFINADLFAAGLPPSPRKLAALKARRLMLQEIDNCVKQK
jgi:predicted ABC-type ATPase